MAGRAPVWHDTKAAVSMALISRRSFVSGATALLLASPLAAEAQQPKRPWRIGMFNAGVRLPESVAGQEWFREELRSRGYVQRQKVVYEERWAEGHAERLPDLAADLVRLNVDLIVAVGTAQALAARNVRPSQLSSYPPPSQSRWAWSPAWHDRAASEGDEGCKGSHQGPESHREWHAWAPVGNQKQFERSRCSRSARKDWWAVKDSNLGPAGRSRHTPSARRSAAAAQPAAPQRRAARRGGHPPRHQ